MTKNLKQHGSSIGRDSFIMSCFRRIQRSSCEQATNYDCMTDPRFLEASRSQYSLVDWNHLFSNHTFCYAPCIILFNQRCVLQELIILTFRPNPAKIPPEKCSLLTSFLWKNENELISTTAQDENLMAITLKGFPVTNCSHWFQLLKPWVDNDG